VGQHFSTNIFATQSAFVENGTDGSHLISVLIKISTGSGAHPASCTMGTGGKARPGRDADHSPPSSAEVVNE
jgi:hypothetical protein